MWTCAIHTSVVQESIVLDLQPEKPKTEKLKRDPAWCTYYKKQGPG